LVKKSGRSKHRIEIEGSVRRPPMVRNEPVEKIWTRIKSLADKLDYRLVEEHRWSSADICFVDSEKPRIDGLGAIGTDRIDEDEFILRHSLLERATLLAMLLYDLSKEKIK
jgi:D-alanine-D-alanine ligase